MICLQTAAIGKNDFETAIFALREAYAVAPENVKTIRKIADLYQRSGDIGAAICWIKSCSEKQTLDINLICHLGGLYLENRNIDEAERWLLSALDMNPCHVLSCLRMNRIFVARKLPHEALKWAEKALKLAPSNSLAYGAAATALLKLQQCDAARDMIVAGLKILPNDRSLLAHLAKIEHLGATG